MTAQSCTELVPAHVLAAILFSFSSVACIVLIVLTSFCEPVQQADVGMRTKVRSSISVAMLRF